MIHPTNIVVTWLGKSPTAAAYALNPLEVSISAQKANICTDQHIRAELRRAESRRRISILNDLTSLGIDADVFPVHDMEARCRHGKRRVELSADRLVQLEPFLNTNGVRAQ